MAEQFEAIETTCARVGRDPATLQRASATAVALSASGTSGAGITTFEQDGMVREVRSGSAHDLIEYARSFETVGADLLTLTLIDPPGPKGIEQLAPVVEGLG